MGGSLHCSCGVWLVKETPLSAVRLRRGRCWVAASIRRSCGGVCVCTRVPVKGHFLSPKPDRLSGRPLGQAQQQQQQPGLAAESPKEEGHQVLHRSFAWQKGKGPAWTQQQGGLRTRWVLHRSEGGGSACMSLLCVPLSPRGSCHSHWVSSWEEGRRRLSSLGSEMIRSVDEWLGGWMGELRVNGWMDW